MKHRFLKQAIGILLLFSLACLPAAAITPTYTISGAYRGSRYHNNLLTLPTTGDLAFDVLAVALSQLDYHEGNSTADYAGQNANGTRNYTEYNRALGSVGGTYSYYWCAAFVSWCLKQAGAGNSAGGSFASCTLWVDALRDMGRYSTRASGYTPKAGDLIFFRSAGVSRASDHVGIVRYVKNGRVYTVEGNSSNRVSANHYALTDTYIVGYGRPNYASGYTLPTTALAAEDQMTGFYTVTNSFVNVRAAATATATKRGTLQRGELIKITSVKDGWGMFYYKEKTAYVSLDYVDFTSPLQYTVSYITDEGQGSPFKASYYSVERCYVTDTVPIRENHVFIGWKDDSGKVFTAGDTLPLGDLSLTAVWEALPATEAPDIDTPPTDSESVENEGFFDTPGGILENTAPSIGTAQASNENRAAGIAAGVVIGAAAFAATGVWYYRKKHKDEEE